MNRINFLPSYYPLFDQGHPIENGKIYIGIPDTDPTIISNQYDIFALQENGEAIALVQPIRTGAGGVPSYNGSPVILGVRQNDFAITISDKDDQQIYYFPYSNLAASLRPEIYVATFEISDWIDNEILISATEHGMGSENKFVIDVYETTIIDENVTIFVQVNNTTGDITLNSQNAFNGRVIIATAFLSYTKSFLNTDWVSNQITIPASEHLIGDSNRFITTVYEVAGGYDTKTTVSTKIDNSNGDVFLSTQIPFDGKIIIM